MKRTGIIWLMGLFLLLSFVPVCEAATSCLADSVLTFNIDSILTEVTVYEYGDINRTTVWTVNPDGSRIGKSREESFTSSLKEIKATYAWDNTINDWIGTEKYEKIYKVFAGSKKMISNTTFAWVNAAWVPDTRETFNYDAAVREIEYFEYKRNTSTNELVPVKGHEYVWLDDTRKSLEIEYTAYGTTAWKTGTKKEWAFDAEDRQTLYAYSTITNGTWIGSSKETWAYEGPDGQLTLHETFGWASNDWSKTLREETEYSGTNIIRVENYTYTNGVTSGTNKETWAYEGPDGQLTMHEKYTWASNDWSKTSREETEYSGTNIIRKENLTYSNGVTSGTKETWEYNGPSGQLTLHEKYGWASTDWSKTLKEETEYSGANIVRIENYSYANGVTTGTKKELTTYTSGKKTEFISYTWKNNDWVGLTKEVWTYTPGKLTLHEKYSWASNDWSKTLKEETEYSGANVIRIENYSYANGVTTGTKKELTTYTSGKKTEYVTFAWGETDWVNKSKETWTTSGNVATHAKFDWSEGAWLAMSEEKTTTVSGKTTQVENYERKDGVWAGTKKEEYAYTSGKQTEVIIYKWENGNWVKSDRETWAYTSGKQTLHEKFGWNGAEWIRTHCDKNGYDAAGNQTLVENYVLTVNGWTGTKKEEYTYSGSTKTETVVYAWSDDDWTPYTKNEIGYQEGNTEVTAANYNWSGSAWVGAGTRTYTTRDSENRVTELLTKNWPDGATEWTNATITTHQFNDEGEDILTYNGTWNGSRWAVSSMERLDKIFDEQGRQLLKASWKCGSDLIWIGVEKDTAKYSATDKLLFTAKYKGWKNNDWVPKSKTENTYNADDKPLLEESYNWLSNKWQGVYRYEYAYDEQGRQTIYAIYKGWNTSTSSWKGSSRQDYVYYKDYNDKYESTTTYSWKNNQWSPVFSYLYTYDESGREIEQIVRSFSNNTWKNKNKYVKVYRGSKLFGEYEYAWSNNEWAIRSQKELYYDEDAQAKLRREIIGTWTSAGLSSFDDKHYIYNCDPFLIRFVNDDGTLLSSETLYKGSIPAYSGETPTKPADAEFTYTFAGWTPAIKPVAGNATYMASYTATKNSYTITWLNEDGSQIDQSTVEYGATPAHVDPSKPATAQYTYTFAGWTPEIVDVTGDATYQATFSSTVNQYIISWLNEDGSQIDQSMVEYGATPAHADPSKPATAQYTYTFAGWTPEVVSVTGDATYQATFSSTVNQYIISWLNEDGSQIDQSMVEFGATPAHVDPSKPATAQYTYTFAGWTPEVVSVTGEATYQATFSSTVNQYTIIFNDEDGTELSRQVLDYGTMPTCADPSKPATAQYTYTFAGWSPEVVDVTGDATYQATYSSTINQYTITWLNEDGSQIDQSTVEYGATPAHSDPSKPATAQYTYTFAGWTPELVSVTGDATYQATFSSTVNQYIISWLNEDGSQIDQSMVEYGVTPAHADPSKPATAQYTYTFAGWTPEVVSVTGEATYQATFSSTVNQYTIIFNDEDGTELSRQVLDYGTMPTCADPSKPATAQYTYTFAGWDKEVVEVEEDAVYTATYSSTINQYTILFTDEDGTELISQVLDYGTMPSCAEPSKSATAQYTYTFAGWDKEVVSVIGEATYMATYSSTINEYMVTFKDKNGTVLSSLLWEYGAVPTCADPYKAPDVRYTYTFAGWDKEIVEVKEDAVYTATYSSTINQYTILFTDEDGTELSNQAWDYGTMPTCAEPSKQATAQYTYTFAGWDKEIVSVIGEATYVATYSTTVNQYTVTFKDEDGAILNSREWEYGAVPTCAKPTKKADAQYTYAFVGWDKKVVAVTGEAEYTATYRHTLNKYTITFKDEEGKVLSSKRWEYGSTPSCTQPTKPSTAEYTYTFAGWNTPVVPVTGDAEYRATFTAAKRKYTITWKNENGTVISKSTLEYGAMPAHADAYMKNTVGYTYTFAGWAPEIVPVTEDAVYVAVFTATPNQFTIVFKNDNGKELQNTKVDYGTKPEYKGKEPTKPAEAHCVYTFAGWTPNIVTVSGDATYTAVFDKILDTYSIVFYDEDGKTLLDKVTTEYGQKPSTDVVPTKEEDDTFTYTFAGWEPKLVPAVKNATYKATYTAVRKDVEMDVPTEKIIKDNTIYLQHGDHIYTLQGQLVK